MPVGGGGYLTAMDAPLPGPRIRMLVTPGRARTPGTAAVWLPWIVAPLFMAAPIGGCAVAERWRAPVADAAAGPAGPVVPDGAVATVERR
ncbi:MAG: hypothetical protein EBZ74_00855 [Planctomycetia bacterium]|nr:hypothetical protein [Planctomycetia bacterium]